MSLLTENTSKLRKILEKVENLPEIPGSVAQATPSITVSSGGLITAIVTQEAGMVSAGTKSATRQLTTKSGTTITPSNAEQTAVSAGTFVTGDIKVAAAASGTKTASGTVAITRSGACSIKTGFEPIAVFIYTSATLSMTSRIKHFVMLGSNVSLVTYAPNYYYELNASSYSPTFSNGEFTVNVPSSGTYRNYQFDLGVTYNWYAVG